VGDKVAAAVVHNQSHNCKSVRLPNNISTFRAELYAVVLVRHSREQDFIIFSDSKSSLEAINSFQIEVDLVHKFLKDYTLLLNSGKKSSYVGSQVTQVSVVTKKLTQQQKQLFHSSMKHPASEFFHVSTS